jgi:hypothetical protein
LSAPCIVLMTCAGLDHSPVVLPRLTATQINGGVRHSQILVRILVQA